MPNTTCCLLFIVLIFFNFHVILAQEICNIAIDDDYDGLVDLNDDECACDGISILPSSLLPNPSFEDYNCLPTLVSQMNCVDDWDQASITTTDYYNTLNTFYTVQIIPLAPLPIPDGTGYVGFINNWPDEPWKEYIGVCLTNPLQANTTYTIYFDLGFGDDSNSINQADPISSDSIILTLYGSPMCNLPFGNYYTTGCPLNYTGWDVLGSKSITGDNEWVQESITFTTNQDYETFVIGGDCLIDTISSYFYLDNLTLNTSSQFVSESIISSKVDCNEYILSVNSLDLNVQWYKNGIALIGEINDTLFLD